MNIIKAMVIKRAVTDAVATRVTEDAIALRFRLKTYSQVMLFV